nr:uncharacterized protein LOC114925404 isoform X1 [Arachis hypogaea]
MTICSRRFSSGGVFASSYNFCVRASCRNFIKLRGSVAQVFPPTIFFGGDLLHQRFSSIDEICCASVFYGIELCSAISPSPSSFIEHLGFLFSSLLEEIGGDWYL